MGLGSELLELDLQVSTCVCAAVAAPDPAKALASRAHFHNVAIERVGIAGPCAFLLACNDGGKRCTSSKLQLPPTLHLAVAATRSAVQGCKSGLCNLLCGQAPLDAGLVPGANVHAVAAKVIEELPVQQLLNFLGQGYRVVLAGQAFGGLVAHTLAAKLLLQVQHEIDMALKLGVNLSALSQTKDKVVSFAFGAPLFAGAALQAALAASQLDANMHTLWADGDASAHFLTVASELATEEASAAPGHSTDGAPPTITLGSAPLKALARCCTVLSTAVAGVEGAAQRLPLVCAPLDGAAAAVTAAPPAGRLLGSVGSASAPAPAPQGLNRQMSQSSDGRAATGGAALAKGAKGAATMSSSQVALPGAREGASPMRRRGSSVALNGSVGGPGGAGGDEPPERMSAPGNVALKGAGAGAGREGAAGGGRAGTRSPVRVPLDLRASVAEARREAPVGGDRVSGTGASTEHPSVGEGNEERLSTGGRLSAPRAAGVQLSPALSKSAGSDTPRAKAGPGVKQGPGGTHAGAKNRRPAGASALGTSSTPDQGSGGPADEAAASVGPALSALLSLAPTALRHHTPIGRFWVLECCEPDGKSKASEPLASLRGVPEAGVAALGRSWLSSGCSGSSGAERLLGSWECSIEEMQRNLMEVFAWFTFTSTKPA